MLLLAFLSFDARANDMPVSAHRQCAALRLALHQHIGVRSTALFAFRADMNSDGWLDPYAADVAFRALKVIVMQFDHAYERVGMGRDANAKSCYALALRYGQEADSYVDVLLSTFDNGPQ